MPGTVVFKPIEANITHNTELLGKMDPYCLFHVGTQKIKSQVCRKGGKHPQWEDSVVVPITNQPTCVVDLKDKDLLHDDKIGTFEVDLREVQNQGRLKKWYPLFHKEKPAGEILMEAIYTGDTTAGLNQGIGSTVPLGGEKLLGAAPITNSGFGSQEIVSNTVVGQSYVVNEVVGTSYVVNQGMQGLQGGFPMQGGNILGGGLPTTGIYGSQGMPGDNVLPVLGGSFPSTHSGVMGTSGASTADTYAQEAILRGCDPLNVQAVNRHNMANSGMGYSGFNPTSQFGNPSHQVNMPINATSQQLPMGQNLGGGLGRDMVIEEAGRKL